MTFVFMLPNFFLLGCLSWVVHRCTSQTFALRYAVNAKVTTDYPPSPGRLRATELRRAIGYDGPTDVTVQISIEGNSESFD